MVQQKTSKNHGNMQRFRIRTRLLNRDRYNMNDLIRELVHDDINILNLEYWCNNGFRQFFRMSPTKLEELLVEI